MTDRPTSEAMQPCDFCGMPCKADEYHPYAACLMFKACHNSEVVRANLEAVRGTPPPAVAREDEALIQQLQDALEESNTEWKSLADSGDAGFWKAEEQDHYQRSATAIVAARTRLGIQTGEKT
jgi:hypothetical protein